MRVRSLAQTPALAPTLARPPLPPALATALAARPRLILDACPRCSGPLAPDWFDDYYCLQCGWVAWFSGE